MPDSFLLGPGLLSRVRRVVDRVEGMPYSDAAASLGVRVLDDQPARQKVFRIATFSGAWSIGATKTVTFKYQTATPNTANVTNLFFPIVGTATSSMDCAIAKDGTAWFLIDVPLATATAVFVSSLATQTVVSNVLIAASLNTANCAITVTRTQTTASVTIVAATQARTVLSLA